MKFIMTALLFLLPSMVSAGNVDDKAALADLKSVNIIVDVNVKEAKLLLRRLELIDDTYSQLLDAGITPTMRTFSKGDSHDHRNCRI